MNSGKMAICSISIMHLFALVSVTTSNDSYFGNHGMSCVLSTSRDASSNKKAKYIENDNFFVK